MTIEEVVILGAGPAGIAAALQLRRHGIPPLVFEKDAPGGLLKNAYRIENFPGIPEAVSGPRLVSLLAEQLRRSGARVVREEVVELGIDAGLFSVRTATATTHARIAVIASGTRPREVDDLELPPQGASRIFYEVYPLREVRDAQIAIVGAGDAAFDYAVNLSARNVVLILNRGTKIRCLHILQERARAIPQITYRDNCRIERVQAGTDGLWLECRDPSAPRSAATVPGHAGELPPARAEDSLPGSSGDSIAIRADYLIFAIGRDPALGFVSPDVQERAAELEKRGDLHFIGDVKSGIFRQSAIAAGQGVHAAMRIAQRLRERAE